MKSPWWIKWVNLYDLLKKSWKCVVIMYITHTNEKVRQTTKKCMPDSTIYIIQYFLLVSTGYCFTTDYCMWPFCLQKYCLNKLPLVAGIILRMLALWLIKLFPNMVIESELPPKLSIFAFIHFRAKTWSQRPLLPGIFSSPVDINP